MSSHVKVGLGVVWMRRLGGTRRHVSVGTHVQDAGSGPTIDRKGYKWSFILGFVQERTCGEGMKKVRGP